VSSSSVIAPPAAEPLLNPEPSGHVVVSIARHGDASVASLYRPASHSVQTASSAVDPATSSDADALL
jgi:hypothetical protein